MNLLYNLSKLNILNIRSWFIFIVNIRSWFIFIVFIFSMGCTTWNKWIGNDEKPKIEKNAKVESLIKPAVEEDTIRFSENPNIGTFNERRYKRQTRKTIEDDSDVGSRAGSLWNTEGPSSYLFSQNKIHKEGDLLNVKIEGNAKTQMDTKIQIIKKLLARLEIVPNPTPDQQSPGTPLAGNELGEGGRGPASLKAEGNPATENTETNQGIVKATSAEKVAPLKVGVEKNSSESDLEIPIQVEAIPTRVTERMSDGNYRVKGQQSFMIGKKEFKVIIMGLVRPEDFTDEGISSNKLLDSQLDVVSLRRSM